MQYFRKQPPKVFCKKDALKDFEIAGLKACYFIKKKLQQCEIFESSCSEEHL